MRSYTLIARAKINLYLEILGDRPDGYHELVMVLQAIELGDRLKISAHSGEEILLSCTSPIVPGGADNLAYQAAQLMYREFPDALAQYGGVEIAIEKHVPMAAGLAGGSTDAAATLVGIDLIWDLGLTQPELQTLAAELGSDVPFCIAGGTALATGRGEQINALNSPPKLAVVLAKPRQLQVSTAWAYRTHREQFGHDYPITQQHSGEILSAIALQDSAKIGQLLHNDLERVVIPAHPQIDRLKTAFQEAGVVGTMMSGSGPTVFALCESLEQARDIRQKVRQTLGDSQGDIDFWITHLSSAGIEVIQ